MGHLGEGEPKLESTSGRDMIEARPWDRAYAYLLYQMLRKLPVVFETRSSDICPNVVGTFGDGADEGSILQCLQKQLSALRVKGSKVSII